MSQWRHPKNKAVTNLVVLTNCRYMFRCSRVLVQPDFHHSLSRSSLRLRANQLTGPRRS